MKIKAPGKLLLSGEHAVVYGAPAIATTLNRFTTCSITPTSENAFILDIPELSCYQKYQTEELLKKQKTFERRYKSFINEKCSIKTVLRNPHELVEYAIGRICKQYKLSLEGLRLKIDSDVPVGCGMGSSAAVILSCLLAIVYHFDLSMTEGELLYLSAEIEDLQHGETSGADLYIIFRGGCLFLDRTEANQRHLQFSLNMINTGKPESTTGECIFQATQFFKSKQLVTDFTDVTKALDQALKDYSLRSIRNAVRENHRLLSKIKVVPDKIKKFIHEIESSGGAAKVCGAGAIRGDNAGILWVIHEDEDILYSIADDFNFQLTSLDADVRGLHVV